jgi:hypothetical protein
LYFGDLGTGAWIGAFWVVVRFISFLRFDYVCLRLLVLIGAQSNGLSLGSLHAARNASWVVGSA